MYFKGTKCFLFILCFFTSFSLLAKDVSTQIDQKNFKKPLCFVENKGQIKDEQNNFCKEISYKLSTPGLNLYLGKNTLLYRFNKTEGTPANGLNITCYQVGVKLLGANKDAEVLSQEFLDYHENYYTTIENAEGFTAHAYNKVVYKDVYPNIDWVLYVKDSKVEYDFIVKNGGDASNIKIEYSGATSLSITTDGGIKAVTPMGTIEEAKPFAYENATGKAVSSKFRLDGNIISFETGAYNGTLTIDPYLGWSTYFGGANEDVATSVTSFGGTGLLYAAGYTSSTTGISFAIGLPFNTYGGGTYDAFLASYSAAGVMAWATYFGGVTTDMGTGIAVDGTGNLFLTGNTNSTGMGTPGTYQPNYTAGNGMDAFLVKFNNLGVRQWSTYFGGTGDDYANAIACDAAGAIYIAGQTSSPTLIASAGAFQTALSGTTDGFFAKFTTTGTLTFASYFGGSAQDDVLSIHCDATGNFVFCGQTNSAINIATIGAHQTTLSGTNDAFIESFSSTGTRNWGTYFGGTGIEIATGITCDGLNNVAVVGNTSSPTNIASANAYQSAFGGIQDAFIALFSTTGALTWSTYYGGNNVDYGTGISVDNLNNFAICGYTLSGIGIASTPALQVANAGSFDGFIAKLDPLGRRFWGTYFGGIFNDYANSITFDANDLLTFVGSTGSSGGLYSAGGIASTATAQQPVYGGGTTDGFITQFTLDTIVEIVQPYIDTLVCAGGTLVVAYTTNSTVSTTLSVQLSDASGNFPPLITTNIIGSATSTTLAGTITCTIPAGALGTNYRIRIISSTPSFISPDDYYNIHIITSLPLPNVAAKSPICLGQIENMSVTANYIITGNSWTGPNGFTSLIFNPTIPVITMADSGMHFVTISHNGCPSVLDSVLVKVDSSIPPTPIATVGSPACTNYPVTLYANPGAGVGMFTYTWTGPGGFNSTLQNPSRLDVAGSAAGVYTLIDTLGGCPSLPTTVTVTLTGNTTVNIHININPGDTVCKGDNVSFSSTTLNGGPDPFYQWMSGTPDTPIVGANWDYWASSHLQNGERIYCIITSDAPCAYPIHDTSNMIVVHVADSTPVAYITASPDSIILSGQLVSFFAYAVYPGTITVYQWYVNDTLVPGANSYIYTIPNITTHIRVRVKVFTPSRCANPDTASSNSISIHFNNGITNTTAAFTGIELYPNPNTGTFTISGTVSEYNDDKITYDIINTLGQVILSDVAAIKNDEILKTIDLKTLSGGVYIINLHGAGQSKIIRFTVQK